VEHLVAVVMGHLVMWDVWWGGIFPAVGCLEVWLWNVLFVMRNFVVHHSIGMCAYLAHISGDIVPLRQFHRNYFVLISADIFHAC
jgi:hypothetical protein